MRRGLWDLADLLLAFTARVIVLSLASLLRPLVPGPIDAVLAWLAVSALQSSNMGAPVGRHLPKNYGAGASVGVRSS
jgi:hypothetical protein